MPADLTPALQWLNQRRRDFRDDDSGASTVEMVMGMAMAIGLSLSVMDVVTRGIDNLSGDIRDFLTDYEITTSFNRAEAGPDRIE
ncbi:MAG: pilus assembly protein [Rhodobacteraceae bacterium]|nr:pilus assembly protein [Paracoccaceae bacterium]MCB1366364.1 pilus assembly protein [Paracoccaceae bacterium]